MFEISSTQAKLCSVNARAEKHGSECHPAFDLKFEATLPNTVLDHFDPGLRHALYKRSDSPDLVEQTDPQAANALRYPKLSPIGWDWEGAGYRLIFEIGASGEGNIELADVEIDGFTFAPQEGGSVIVKFRAIVHPQNEEVGDICEYIQQTAQISLVSPETLAKDEAQQVIQHASN